MRNTHIVLSSRILISASGSDVQSGAWINNNGGTQNSGVGTATSLTVRVRQWVTIPPLIAGRITAYFLSGPLNQTNPPLWRRTRLYANPIKAKLHVQHRHRRLYALSLIGCLGLDALSLMHVTIQPTSLLISLIL